jgi:hypothetical protein
MKKEKCVTCARSIEPTLYLNDAAQDHGGWVCEVCLISLQLRATHYYHSIWGIQRLISPIDLVNIDPPDAPKTEDLVDTGPREWVDEKPPPLPQPERDPADWWKPEGYDTEDWWRK